MLDVYVDIIFEDFLMYIIVMRCLFVFYLVYKSVGIRDLVYIIVNFYIEG